MTTDRSELADEGLTAQLADALRGDWGDERHEIALALLPVVRRYGDQRAVEALEATADIVDDWHLSACDPVIVLRDRAAALREAADHDR